MRLGVEATIHPSPGQRLSWLIFGVSLGLISALCFWDTVYLGLDTHDGQMFRNNEELSQDWHHFLQPSDQKETTLGGPQPN